jgi:hypothetical protein
MGAPKRRLLLCRLRHSSQRGSRVEPNGFGHFQELQHTDPVLAALDSADERLAATDQLGYVFLTSLRPLAPFSDQTPQYILPGRSKFPHSLPLGDYAGSPDDLLNHVAGRLTPSLISIGVSARSIGDG